MLIVWFVPSLRLKSVANAYLLQHRFFLVFFPPLFFKLKYIGQIDIHYIFSIPTSFEFMRYQLGRVTFYSIVYSQFDVEVCN